MEISLLNLKTGKKAKIKRIDGGSAFHTKLASLNIRVGKILKKVTAQPFRGPIIIKIDGRESTLGMGIAVKIFVEEQE